MLQLIIYNGHLIKLTSLFYRHRWHMCIEKPIGFGCSHCMLTSPFSFPFYFHFCTTGLYCRRVREDGKGSIFWYHGFRQPGWIRLPNPIWKRPFFETTILTNKNGPNTYCQASCNLFPFLWSTHIELFSWVDNFPSFEKRKKKICSLPWIIFHDITFR